MTGMASDLLWNCCENVYQGLVRRRVPELNKISHREYICTPYCIHVLEHCGQWRRRPTLAKPWLPDGTTYFDKANVNESFDLWLIKLQGKKDRCCWRWRRIRQKRAHHHGDYMTVTGLKVLTGKLSYGAIPLLDGTKASLRHFLVHYLQQLRFLPSSEIKMARLPGHFHHYLLERSKCRFIIAIIKRAVPSRNCSSIK